MKKSNILKSLQQAKPDHIKWIKQGYKLLEGEPQEKLQKPIDCTNCAFGKWYYSEGFKLINIPVLKDIEQLHQEIHKTYTALYYITFDRRKKARTTLISGGVELPVKETKFRQEKLKQLEKKTIKLIHEINMVEKQVTAMDEKVFENGWLI